MNQLYFFLFWILFSLPSLSAAAQALESQLRNYTDRQAGEQIYVQLSEEVVGAGEPLWFQAHITHPDTSRTLSRVVYLELFNQQQAAVVQGIYSAAYGVASGQLTLPDTLGGWYQLRAYTQAMRNGHLSNFFTQPILVVDPSSSNPAPASPAIVPGISIFPEGGHWIADQENNVVLRNTDSTVSNLRLEVLQAFDSTVVANSTTKDGLGTFTFTPLTDSSYIVRLIAADTTYLQIPLATSDGYTLQASIEENNLAIRATTSIIRNPAFLLVRSRNHLIYQLPIRQNSLSAIVPTAGLSGLLQVAILNDQGKELAQRLIYTEDETIRPTVTLSATTVAPREEMRVIVSNIQQKSAPEVDGFCL